MSNGDYDAVMNIFCANLTQLRCMSFSVLTSKLIKVTTLKIARLNLTTGGLGSSVACFHLVISLDQTVVRGIVRSEGEHFVLRIVPRLDYN